MSPSMTVAGSSLARPSVQLKGHPSSTGSGPRELSAFQHRNFPFLDDYTVFTEDDDDVQELELLRKRIGLNSNSLLSRLKKGPI